MVMARMIPGLFKGLTASSEAEVKVYNRWGSLVAQAKPYTNANGWDGKSNNSVSLIGEDLPKWVPISTSLTLAA